MALILLYLIGALALSFLCSILEAVLLSTPMSFITMKEKQGYPLAIRLRDYKTNIDRPVSAILSLNTIAHTIGAAGVGSESVKIFGEAYFGIISVVLTLLILVLSEIIPKTIGATYWRRLALPATSIIHVLIFITYPLVLLSELITKLFSSKHKQLSVSREEVSAMVDLGTQEGIFERKEGIALKSVMKLNSVKAEEIMTPRTVVDVACEHLSVKELMSEYEMLAYSRIPVFNETNDYITGYVLKDDVMKALSDDRFDVKLTELKRHILCFNEAEQVLTIWEQMLDKREHISVITDNYGCLRGIVTMEDVVETMLGVEIVDENDTTEDMQQLAIEKSLKQKIGDVDM